MKDPKPENIAGKKAVTHSVNHSVDWGTVFIVIGVIFVAWYVDPFGKFVEDDDENGGL